MEQIQGMAHVLDLLDSIKKYLYTLNRDDPVVERKTPSSITFSKNGGIIFDQQLLYYGTSCGTWLIDKAPGIVNSSCKLTPCARDGLRVGDVAHMSNDEHDDFVDLDSYFIILGDVEQVHWVDGSVGLSETQFTYIYKVEMR